MTMCRKPPESELVDAVRFHEAALNSLFENAAQRGLKIELQGASGSFAFGYYRVEGDEWKEGEVPPQPTARLQILIHKPL